MQRKSKVVFQDAGKNKVAFGILEDLGDFIKVTENSKSITINKRFVVSIKEGDF